MLPGVAHGGTRDSGRLAAAPRVTLGRRRAWKHTILSGQELKAQQRSKVLGWFSLRSEESTMGL